MIQRLNLPRSEENRAYLKMGEILFNMHETLPEQYFPPPSRMKVTSRRTTYPRMSMIQLWNREKSAGDQNCSAKLFPFVFQKRSDDDFRRIMFLQISPVS